MKLNSSSFYQLECNVQLFFTAHSCFSCLYPSNYLIFYCKVVFSISFYFFTLMPFQIGMSLKYFCSLIKKVCVCVYIYIYIYVKSY